MVNLRELAAVFLKLGCIGFGGPAAHIALMEAEIVRRRAWLPRETFLDLLAAAHLIPGPNSTELAIHIGHRMRGWRGLLLAGGCFILPAALIVGALGWAYQRWGALPQVGWLMYGIKPVIIAIIAQAVWSMGRSALETRGLAILALLALGLELAGVNELALLFGSGAAWGLLAWRSRFRAGAAGLGLLALAGLPASAAAAAGTAAIPFGLWPLFWFFLKVGSVLFGSGYVLLAFLDAGLVERYGWLTRAQLLDAVAIGQIIPGPVSTTATFIGYLLGGPIAAVVATIGIFLPSFFFVAISGPLIPRLRSSPIAGAALDGVVVASLGLMAAVALQLARAAIVDVPTGLVALGSAVALLRYKVGSAWIVLAGGAAGLAVSALR